MRETRRKPRTLDIDDEDETTGESSTDYEEREEVRRGGKRYEEEDSMLPDESLPHFMDVTDRSFESFGIARSGGVGGVGDGRGVMKMRSAKNRPSLLDYYGQEALGSTKNKTATANNSNKKMQDPDIDETFDFLDEELKKY